MKIEAKFYMNHLLDEMYGTDYKVYSEPLYLRTTFSGPTFFDKNY